MRILLINANQEKMPEPVFPIGLSYIAAALKEKGHLCQGIDLTLHAPQECIPRTIVEFRPEAIGISIRNVDNTAYPITVSYLPFYRKVMALVRASSPGVPVVLGGSGFSLFPDEFMDELGADYGIIGEGERAFCDLLAMLETSSSPKKLYGPTLPYLSMDEVRASRELFDVKTHFSQGGSLNIQTKRGCPFHCSYCTYPTLEGKHIRQKSPVLVVDEIEQCQKEWGVDYFFFVDNVFNFPTEHAVGICDELIRRKMDIRFTAYVSPAPLEEGTIAKFKEAGCSCIDLGTDSASPKILERLGKGFGVREILDVSRWCIQHDVRFNHSLIFGTPGETVDTVEETLSNIVSCRPTAVIAMIGVRVYRETPLARQLEKEGWIEREKITLQPVFYLEEGVKEYLGQRLEEISEQELNWAVPGLKKRMNERFFKRLRSRGVKGPIWESFLKNEKGNAHEGD